MSKPRGSHLGVGEFTTHFRTYFSWGLNMIESDVYWGYGALTNGQVTLFEAFRLDPFPLVINAPYQ